jgi:hypothetical protein
MTNTLSDEDLKKFGFEYTKMCTWKNRKYDIIFITRPTYEEFLNSIIYHGGENYKNGLRNKIQDIKEIILDMIK